MRAFEDTRRAAVQRLTETQDMLRAAVPHGVAQHRARQDALSLICAAKAELQKVALPREDEHVVA